MRRIGLGLAVILAFIGINFASAQLPPGPVPILHVMSFCPTGCDSAATTWTVPAGSSNVTATYCGTGGAGGGGYAGTANAGGGGGAGGTCWVNWPITAKPGTVVTLTYAAGPTGAVASAQGLSGTASLLSWTQGAYAYSTPPAYSGGGGLVGGVAIGGNGGANNASQNGVAGVATSQGDAFGNTAGGTGGTGASGAAGGSVSLTGGFFMAGSPGGGGGAAAGAYAGGGARAYQLTTANGIAGGAAGNANTCGGGGAGGGSILAAGGIGGTYGGAGANGAGNAGGGGGAPCNGAGGNGGDGIIILTWVQ